MGKSDHGRDDHKATRTCNSYALFRGDTNATMSSSIQSRKEELLAKKARLAELKRQRELRQEQFSAGRQSIGGEVCTYHRNRLQLRIDPR